MDIWDVTYWSEKMKEEKYGFSEEELRPNFAMDTVLNGLFGLLDRLFNVAVIAADGDAEVWHKDVRYFKIKNKETTKTLASFFLDPYSRPGSKQGGAWMNGCVGKSKVLKQEIPTAYIICNGSPPTSGMPALMTFDEVRTLFHEMGHGLQHMRTEVDDGNAAGINNIEWDAVEFPSQFMENWLYDKSTLSGFATHYETGQGLPERVDIIHINGAK